MNFMDILQKNVQRLVHYSSILKIPSDGPIVRKMKYHTQSWRKGISLKRKVTQPRYRPGVAQKVPRS